MGSAGEPAEVSEPTRQRLVLLSRVEQRPLSRSLKEAELSRCVGGASRTVSRRGHPSALDRPVPGPPPKIPARPEYRSPARRHPGPVTALPSAGRTRHAASSLHRPFFTSRRALSDTASTVFPLSPCLSLLSPPSLSLCLCSSLVRPSYHRSLSSSSPFLRRKRAQRDKDPAPPDLPGRLGALCYAASALCDRWMTFMPVFRQSFVSLPHSHSSFLD
ncbi:hypothetical protein VTN02DRAFT_6224 [Thermoascus thermophilus]